MSALPHSSRPGSAWCGPSLQEHALGWEYSAWELQSGLGTPCSKWAILQSIGRNLEHACPFKRACPPCTASLNRRCSFPRTRRLPWKGRARRQAQTCQPWTSMQPLALHLVRVLR